jgi:hypothetical protein
MLLTPAQQATLKAHIAANVNQVSFGGVNTAINAIPNNDDGHFAIAAWYNLQASPDFTVWKTNVPINQIGDKINGTELAGLSTLNNTRLQTAVVLASGGFNPSLVDRRAFFDDIFSGAGGTTTRANLLILWKRLCSNIEKLFASGTGSNAAPATLVVEGTVSYQDIANARNLPA